MLEARNLTLSRGGKTLVAHASFLIGRGDKVGLVGVNGAGKTTLLKTLAGALDSDAGTVIRTDSAGYLGQERLTDDLLVDQTQSAETATVREAMLAGRHLTALDAELRAIEAQLAVMPTPVVAASAAPRGGDRRRPLTLEAGSMEALLARYGEVQEQFQHAGGYEAEHEIAQLLSGLGLDDVELERPVAALSGGQKTRLALARVLFTAPDLLLLDEPTNHLDGPAIRWLMDYLARFEGAIILISHDLALLDQSITRVLHLDAGTRTLTAYNGNYSAYLRQRDQTAEQAAAQAQRQEAKISQLRDQANWMRGKTAKMARRAKVLDHKVERLRDAMPDASALPRKERAMRLNLPITRQSASVVFEAQRLSKGFDGPLVFSDLTFAVERGQRLVVIGRNGAGKTTLLRTLAGLTSPTSGRVAQGDRVDIGYYAQEHESLHPHVTLLDELRLAAAETAERTGKPVGDGYLRTLLGRFLFTGEQAFQQVGTLSGGEKTRLALARLMLGGYNTLLLDEPTNNLDPISRDRVREALESYEGTLVIVSHDTEFVEAVDPDLALILPLGQVRYFEASHLGLVAKV